MKNIRYFFILGFVLVCNTAQQMTSISYTLESGQISNPERGFYIHTEAPSTRTTYPLLTQYTFDNLKSQGFTLILRMFYLHKFVKSDISADYLTGMQNDFNKMRSAGVKCIVRFAYSDSQSNSVYDATKAQILRHIQQLQPLLNKNADVIAVVQAGFVGIWGEWYFTNNFGMEPSSTDLANRREVVDAILAALPTSRMVQIRTPVLKRNLYSISSALTKEQAFKGSNTARIGHHNDCFLASEDDYGTYEDISIDYPYLEQETKYTPMGGETCNLNKPRSQCATALKEMRQFHYSYLNSGYHEEVIQGFKNEGCFSEIQNKLGYRFELVNGLFPKSATIRSTITISLTINNSGFASLYNPRNVYLVLRNIATGAQYPIGLKTDPRFWEAGKSTVITENISLPIDLGVGSYKLFLNLPDKESLIGSRPEYSIRLANKGTWEASTGFNDLLHILTVIN